MCGIYGFIGKPTKETGSFIKRLGILNISRGRDSTGIAFISKRRTVTYKNIVDAYDFYQKDKKVLAHIASFQKSPFVIMLGHTRAATHGAITPNNAHPFWIGDYIITHNGVVSNFYSLQNEYKTDYDVDSQMIGELLNIFPKHTDAYKKLAGYFTVPYVALADRQRLKVAIHSGVFSFAIKGQQLYYTSDIDHLKTVLKGHKGWQICQGGNDICYTFSATENGIKIDREKIKTEKDFVWESPAYVGSRTYSKYDAYDDLAEGFDDDDEYYRNVTEFRSGELIDDHTDDYCMAGKDCQYQNDHPDLRHEMQQLLLPSKTDDKKLFRRKYNKKLQDKEKIDIVLKRLDELDKEEVKNIFKSTNPNVRFD